MRKVKFILTLLISFLLIMPPHESLAKKKTKIYPNLSQYLLPAKAWQKLSPHEQTLYAAFIINLVGIVEISQSRAVMGASAKKQEKKSNSADLNEPWMDRILKFVLPEAHAAVWLAAFSQGAGAAALGSRVATLVRPLTQLVSKLVKPGAAPKGFDPSYIKGRITGQIKGPKYKGAIDLKPYYLKSAKAAKDKKGSLKSATDKAAKSKKSNALGLAGRVVSHGATGATFYFIGKNDSSGSNPQEQGAYSDGQAQAQTQFVRGEGASCIYGGHKRVYVEVSAGLYCDPPTDYINEFEGCVGTADEPKIVCNTFGMEKSESTSAALEAACVSLYPLDDLTVRCSQSLTNWLTTEPPNRLNVEEYEAWRKEVAQHFVEYDKSFGDITWSQYCENGNFANEHRQAAECQALTELLRTFTELSPTADNLIASNTLVSDDEPLAGSEPVDADQPAQAPSGQGDGTAK